MKHLILALAFAAGMAGEAYANFSYTYTDTDGLPLYGSLRRVSPNGQWACGGDDTYETWGYIVNTDDPENVILTDEGYFLDIDDNGTAVGTYYEKINYATYQRAGYWRDGFWFELPMPEDVIGQSQAVAISRDSKVIAGHAMGMNESPDMPGRYFPITWRLNEATGEYELDRYYNGLYLPGTLGFFVYDMTPNGRYICGIQCLDFGDYIAALLDTATGELKIWHDIEIRDTYFEVVDGVFPTMYVDGMMDGWDATGLFAELLMWANDRYAFGSHATVSDVDEETGEGYVTNVAAALDLRTMEWVDSDLTDIFYMCGTDPDEVFTSSGLLIQDHEGRELDDIVMTSDHTDGIYSFDDEGRVWVGSYTFWESFGDLVESPVLIVLDEPGLTNALEALRELQPKHQISIGDGAVTVAGAERVDIYTVQGAHVASGAKAAVAPGLYIIVADGASYKILVK